MITVANFDLQCTFLSNNNNLCRTDFALVKMLSQVVWQKLVQPA
jgi:hypothetical protein